MRNILQKIVWPIMLIPAAYLALAWKQIPAVIAMQYDLGGNPTRYGSKNEMIAMVVILTGVNALVYLLISNIYRIDPKNLAAENKERLNKIAFAVAAFITAVQCMIIYVATGGSMEGSLGVIFAGVGLLLAIIGNYLPNLKPNYFAGLRLPWTLENADNWRKTHQLAGKIWFAGGLTIAVACLFTPPPATLIIFGVVIMIMVIIPCVYSYKLYKKSKQAHVS